MKNEPIIRIVATPEFKKDYQAYLDDKKTVWL